MIWKINSDYAVLNCKKVDNHISRGKISHVGLVF